MNANLGVEKAGKDVRVALAVTRFVTGVLFVFHGALDWSEVHTIYTKGLEGYPFGSEEAGFLYSSAQLYVSAVLISALLCTAAVLSRFFVRSARVLWGIQLIALVWCVGTLIV